MFARLVKQFSRRGARDHLRGARRLQEEADLHRLFVLTTFHRRDGDGAELVARVMEEGKPEHIAERIVVGRLGKWKKSLCLLDQPFVKDDSKTVAQFTKDTIAVIGENIQIRRFTRYALGEGLAKKEDDFASEVAKMSS